MLDKYMEEDDDIKLPEVPIDILDTKKGKVANLDDKIERRLTRLKFFNQTWLEDVPTNLSIKSNETDVKLSNAAYVDQNLLVSSTSMQKQLKVNQFLALKKMLRLLMNGTTRK